MVGAKRYGILYDITVTVYNRGEMGAKNVCRIIMSFLKTILTKFEEETSSSEKSP